MKILAGSSREGAWWKRRRSLAIVAAVALVAIAVVLTSVLLSHSASSSQSQPLVVKSPSGAEIAAHIHRVPGLAVARVPGVHRSLTSAYSVHTSKRGPLLLSFKVPAGIGGSPSVVGATREHRGDPWVLVPGQWDGELFVINAPHLSAWQLVLTVPHFHFPNNADIQRLQGVRASPQHCPEGSEATLNIDDPQKILLDPCLATIHGNTVLKLANNRSVGLEVSVPQGVAIVRENGATLSDAFWRAFNGSLPSGAGHLLPARGSMTLSLSSLPQTLTFTATPSAFIYDALLAAVGNDATAVAGVLANQAICVHEAVNNQGLRTATDYLIVIRDVLVNCGISLAQGMIFGPQQLAFAIWDSGRSALDRSAVLTVSPPAIVIDAIGQVGVRPLGIATGGVNPSWLADLSWNGWGEASASATGSYHVNSCTGPNLCASADYEVIPVTATLDFAQECGGRSQYMHLQITSIGDSRGALLASGTNYRSGGCGASLGYESSATSETEAPSSGKGWPADHETILSCVEQSQFTVTKLEIPADPFGSGLLSVYDAVVADADISIWFYSSAEDAHASHVSSDDYQLGSVVVRRDPEDNPRAFAAVKACL